MFMLSNLMMATVGLRKSKPPFYRPRAVEETTCYVVIVSLLFSVFNIKLGYGYVEIFNDLKRVASNSREREQISNEGRNREVICEYYPMRITYLVEHIFSRYMFSHTTERK